MQKNIQCKDESVLVIILAETRAYEHSFELFKKNLLYKMKTDLCLCVANNYREGKEIYLIKTIFRNYLRVSSLCARQAMRFGVCVSMKH